VGFSRAKARILRSKFVAVLLLITRKDFASWVIHREKMKRKDEILRTREGAEMKEWLLEAKSKVLRTYEICMGSQKYSWTRTWVHVAVAMHMRCPITSCSVFIPHEALFVADAASSTCSIGHRPLNIQISNLCALKSSLRSSASCASSTIIVH
jgi:hypothetical protein